MFMLLSEVSFMSEYRIYQSDIIEYCLNFDDIPYNAIFGDPPYFLGSIVERFGKTSAAPAKDKDGLFQRQSVGFMGQSWDGFDSPQHYQAWVTKWASLMIEKNVVFPNAVLVMYGGTRTYHRLVSGLEDAGWEIYDSIITWTYGTGFPKSHNIEKAIKKEMPEQEENNRWKGYGTSLKPSYEPIVIARAPRYAFTYADTALTFSTGALNIVGARNDAQYKHGSARWPSNTIFVHHPDCSGDECHSECHIRILDEQSGERKMSSDISGNEPSSKTDGIYNSFQERKPFKAYQDSGTASRFFYQVKPQKWEKEAGLDDIESTTMGMSNGAQIHGEGYDKGQDIGYNRVFARKNPHPTIKPIQLNEHLARLIMPPEGRGRLFVPFSGSGSEIIGAMLAGWQTVTGVEQKLEYIEIAKARLKWWSQFDNFEQAKTFYDGEQVDKQIQADGQLTLW